MKVILQDFVVRLGVFVMVALILLMAHILTKLFVYDESDSTTPNERPMNILCTDHRGKH